MSKSIINLLITSLLLSITLQFVQPWLGAAEKLKFATSVRAYSVFYLPALAAQEKGFWKENGLDTEWVPFSAGGAMVPAVAAGEINVALASVTLIAQAAARGIPVWAVSNLYPKEEFYVYVRADSRFKEPRDLKGAKMSVSRFGAIQHAYGRTVTRALGLEKDVRLVATGGIAETVAALRTGAIDALVLTRDQMINFKIAGEVKELVTVSSYLPKDWVDMVMMARKDFSEKNPDMVKKMVKALLQSLDFIQKNPRWAIGTMKRESGFSEEAARTLYEGFRFTRDGKMEKSAVESVRNFLMEYGIVPKDKTPPATELYTERFLP